MDKYPVSFTETIWTYTDYRELPADGKCYQIVKGVLYMVPSPNFYHQKISRNIEFALWNYVEKKNLGEVIYAPMDVILTETDVVQPDILFVAKERLEIIQERGILGAPDLVIEILSPSTEKIDRELKKNLYERHGVYELLIVDPREKNIHQFVLEQGKYRDLGVFTLKDELPLKSLAVSLNIEKIFK